MAHIDNLNLGTLNLLCFCFRQCQVVVTGHGLTIAYSPGQHTVEYVPVEEVRVGLTARHPYVLGA